MEEIEAGMDEVDRLYECFKCGVATPESASIKKKSRKKRHELAVKNNNSSHLNLNLNLNESTSPNRAPPFSPTVFYGSPQGVPPKKPLSLLRLLRQIHVDLKQQHDFTQSDTTLVWLTFPRQEEAITFTKNHHHTNIFSYQDHLTEKRRFLVTTYSEFWRRYGHMDHTFRHHYELIQEGSPCHLYFDLEFDRIINLGYNRDGDLMVDLLISVVFQVLIDKYDVHLTSHSVLELDSSTDVKFSRHLIIRIPGAAFKDNSHAGAFVSEVISFILAKGDDDKYAMLFVDKDPSHIFVDTSVYSRNRCFRLVFSSKAGKQAVLLPTRRFEQTKITEQELFMQSLVCNMDSDCHKLLVCKFDSECIKTLIFDTETNPNPKIWRRSNTGEGNVGRGCPRDVTPPTYMMGRSPFPGVDAFLEGVTSTGRVQARIRSWYWFSDYGVVVYNMLRNRFCERIGREHKSNHVFYVVDIRRGLYYQKCHDPDCRGYRSPLRHIPDDVSLETGDWDCCDDKCGVVGGPNGDGFACEVADFDGADKNTEFIFIDLGEEGDEDDGWWTAVEDVASRSNL